MNVSGAKMDIPGGKTPFFFTLRGLSNRQELFFLHRHFKEPKFYWLQYVVFPLYK